MYAKIKEIDRICSEREFEDYIKQTIKDKRDQDWIIGTGRGRKIYELLNRSGYDFEGSLVLDLGSGYGGISLFLSEKTRGAIGVDINRELINVAHKRAKIEEGRNFHATISSATNIPIKNSSFDLVLVIGVLEWVPCSYPSENPEHIQLRVMKEARRILKKGGMLLLAIENRYYIGYWMGTNDPHSGLRFATVLPYKLADLMSRIMKGKPFLNRIYSYFELRSVLVKAGFEIVDVFVGIPSYTNPEDIANINAKDEVRSKINSMKQGKLRKSVWGIINTLGLMKLFSSNFIVLCKK